MIKNRQQLVSTQRKIAEARQTAEELTGIDKIPYADLADEMQHEVDEYLAITSGEENVFVLTSIDDLSEALIKARIARGWTQERLASEIGVTEQMVQKDEAGGYERATVTRVAEVLDALGFILRGELLPVHLPEEHWRRRPIDTVNLGVSGINVFNLGPSVQLGMIGTTTLQCLNQGFQPSHLFQGIRAESERPEFNSPIFAPEPVRVLSLEEASQASP